MFQSNIFENSENKRLFAVFTVTAALFIVWTILFTGFFINNLKESVVEREASIAGQLISSGVADKDSVIAAFTSGNNAEFASQGEQAFKAAGYNIKTTDFVLPFLGGEKKSFYIGIIAAAIILLGIIFLAYCVRMNRVYTKIEEARRQAIKISRGDFNTRLDDTEEGAFARLFHAFNEMSAGVSAKYEKLSEDRLFLKNLISDISHQLKTPLSALKMYNEILLQEPLSDAALEFTKKSQEQLERMEWLILGLLKMAMVETGFLDLNIKEHNLMSIIKDSINDFELSLNNKNIEVILSGDDKISLNCDAGWLKEAFGNVIKNCMEYTPQNGKITITIEETPIMISVKFHDSGKGIHRDDLPFIFKRFYRGKGSHSSGSGIGLPLAKSITEQMGGTLTAGGAYGSGAEFTFSFPKTVI